MRTPQVNNPPHEARGVHTIASQSVTQATLFNDTPTAQVAVLRIFPVQGRGNLRAFADVQLTTPLGIFIFRRCRVIQQAGQRAYVSLPQEEWEGRDGKRGYTTLVTLPDAINDAVSDAILRKWQEVSAGG